MSTQRQRPALAGGAGDDLELDSQEWAAAYPRQISADQWQRFERVPGPQAFTGPRCKEAAGFPRHY